MTGAARLGHPSTLSLPPTIHALDYLHSRGVVQQITDEARLRDAFVAGPVTLYVGFDPTAASLHVGNLAQLMILAALQQLGHQVIVLAGGATAMIGDPSGKGATRKAMSRDAIEANLPHLVEQFGRYLIFDETVHGVPPAILVNNADWLGQLSHLDFLREVGQHFSVNTMLAGEPYRSRLDAGGHLSFVEFSYRLLQAYDFLHLFRAHGCVLQLGGSDQWGNIVAGIELIRRVERGLAFGMVSPLITTSTGSKMGKTEQGAIWLDAARTSPFDFFQFWMNVADDDVARFLRIYTFVSEDTIRDLTSVGGDSLREAKRVLATEVTARTHGQVVALDIAEATEALHRPGRDARGLAAQANVIPCTRISRSELEVRDLTIADIVVRAGLCSSRRQARQLVAQGGLTMNGVAVTTVDARFTPEAEAVLLRVGKKRFHQIVLD